jgi:hypothetical protein
MRNDNGAVNGASSFLDGAEIFVWLFLRRQEVRRIFSARAPPTLRRGRSLSYIPRSLWRPRHLQRGESSCGATPRSALPRSTPVSKGATRTTPHPHATDTAWTIACLYNDAPAFPSHPQCVHTHAGVSLNEETLTRAQFFPARFYGAQQRTRDAPRSTLAPAAKDGIFAAFVVVRYFFPPAPPPVAPAAPPPACAAANASAFFAALASSAAAAESEWCVVLW